ncbi:MAG TPA: hypothetical protein VGB77_17425 [Abditibacteriaceae bacterium]|jgi:hypothetical protein
MNRFFPALALLYLILVGALILQVPPGNAPDEVAHVDYVKYIAEQNALPIFHSAAPPRYGYEFHQPPLYYVFCTPGAWLFTGSDLFLWCRAISALFGLGTLFFIAQTVRLLWPQDKQLQWMAIGFAALWPLHLGVSASTGNDSAAGFFCAALFSSIARGATTGWAARDAIWAGVFAALGLWTKTTTLPVAIVAIGAAWQLHQRGFAGRWKGLPAPLIVAIVGFIIALPLFIRNQMLYGDPLGYMAFSKAATEGTKGFPFFSQFGVDLFTYARGILLILFCTCWGFFGGPDSAARALKPLTPQPFPPLLLTPALICVLATITIVFGLLRLRQEDDSPPSVSFAARWWGLGVLFIFLGWAQFAYGHFSGGQARYLHPALLPFCIFSALAWRAVFTGSARIITALIFGLVLFGLVLMNIFEWQTLV